MVLNVNWNWRMPTVGDPNNQANSISQGLQTGAQNFADALRNRRERDQQAQFKQDEMRLLRDKFDYQQTQDEIAQRNRNREFWQQKALNDARLKQMEQELAQKRQQQEWMDKMYAEYFGDVSPELRALRQKFGNSADSALVMNGLNPLLMK